MNLREKALKNSRKYCEKYFNNGYDLNPDSLSELSETYRIQSDSKKYILKYITSRNYISVIDHSYNHLVRVNDLACEINKKSNLVNTIDVVDIKSVKEDTIVLLKQRDIKPLNLKTDRDFVNFGRSLKDFHSIGDSIKFYELPWGNFPDNFIESLKSEGRWDEVNQFLNEYDGVQKSIKITTNHNDLHPGNVYLCDDNYFLLDLDEVCKSAFCNDLGMVIANFLSSEDEDIRSKTEALLSGYKDKFNQNDVLSTLVYALRKLFFTEAYYIFISNYKKQNHSKFISELKKREYIIKSLIKNNK